MFSAPALSRTPAQRLAPPPLPLPMRAPYAGPELQPVVVPRVPGLKLPPADPFSGGWHDSSLDLARGLLVQDLYVEAPNTDWLALFDEDDGAPSGR